MTEITENEKLDNYLEDKYDNADTERLKKMLPGVIAALTGFCFSQLEAFSDLSPFAPAFVAAVPFEYCSGSFTGSVIGYLIAYSGLLTVKNVLCLCFICLVRLLVHKRFPELHDGKFNSLLVFFAVSVAAVMQKLEGGIGFSGAVLSLLEGGVALCSNYFFVRSFKTPVSRIGINNLPMTDRLSLGISVCIFVMCFSGISIEGFLPARLLGCFMLCFAAYCNGAASGSVAGICLGAALSVDPEGRFVFPAFALAGLVGGVFAPMGQIAIGVSVCLSFCLSCVIGGLQENFLLPLIECAVACAVFMLTPVMTLSKISESVYKKSVTDDAELNLQVAQMLKKASHNIFSFCSTVDEVSARLDRFVNPEVNKLFFELQQNVCDGCGKKNACWSRNFDSTAGDVLAIMGIEKRDKGKLQIERHCSRLHELRKEIAQGKARYSMSMLTKIKNREMRKLLTEQFSGIGDFLNELSISVTESRRTDSIKSTALRSVVIDKGVYIDTLNCYEGEGGILEIEITCFERPFETDYKKIKSVLEESTDKIFDEPDITVSEVGTVLRYLEKPVFCLVIGSAQRPFVKDSPCGDSLAFCSCNQAEKAVLLSDGMGTGSSAALDSAMAVSLTEKLLSAGFSFGSSVKIVNSSLIMKSTDESMATMDCLSVNLYTGEAEFHKAGAAISYIRSDREIYVVEKNSLPLGILQEVRFGKSEAQLRAGDIVLLVSDGITAGDCGWINDELLSWSTNNMDDLACHIVELAALRQDRFNGDDLTAVAVKLVKK